jgi:tetratricopeptide (TPR) repeat protein
MRLKIALLLVALAGLSACAQTYVDSQITWPPPEATQPPSPTKPPAMENARSGRAPGKPSPGAMASLTLRRQAVGLIESRRLEEAIRILERAVNLAPSDGVNYYYLAEAWRLKGSTARALEFNRLARLYLGDSETWQERVKRQRHSISSE